MNYANSYDWNPLLSEAPLAVTLSGRLPRGRGVATFQWRSGEVLDTRTDLAGDFRGVPLEIIHSILEQLDLDSLTALSSTCKGMKRVVSSTPKLQDLLNCAPDAMRAVAAARAGHKLKLSDMHDKLLSPRCDHCEQPGYHLHILTCTRLCCKCLKNDERYKALRPLQAVEQYALHRRDVQNLPAMRVPRYCRDGLRCRRWRPRIQINTTGWKLIDRKDVERLAVEIHGSVAEARWLGSERLAKLLADSGSSDTVGEWRMLSSMDRRRRLLNGHGVPFRGPLGSHIPPSMESAYSASTLFPWYDRNTSFFGRPIKCTACVAAKLPMQQCYYTSPGLREHMTRVHDKNA